MLTCTGIARVKDKRGVQHMSPVGNPRWTAPEVIQKVHLSTIMLIITASLFPVSGCVQFWHGTL